MNAEVKPQEFSFRKTFDTSEIAMSLEDVVWALHNDGRFFIQFMIPDELEFPIPEFHIEAWELLTAEKIYEIALALPRGHAKTTLMKLAAVWHWLFTPTKFILYVSNTQPIAAEYCKDIIAYIESDNFKNVFGTPAFSVRQDGKGIYRFRLRVPNFANSEWEEKECILRASGAGQQIRGMLVDNTRPELALVDDLEDDENTATPALIKKLWTWFFGTFKKALTNKKPKIIFAGNLLSKNSLLHYFCSDGNTWYSRRYGCVKADGQPLWPDMWPLDRIITDFNEYQKLGLIGRWFAEMMNLPVAEGQGLIDPEAIPYIEPILPGEQEMAMITLDPAISKSTYANLSAIVVHAYKNGSWRIAEFVTGKYQPDELFWIIVQLALKWKTRAVGIEAAGYQRVLEVVFAIMMQVHRQSFTVCMIPHGNKAKTERLIGWCSFLRKRIWNLQEGDFAITEQLLAYDPTKDNNTDDLIDACSMGPMMLEQYMTVVMEDYNTDHTSYLPKVNYAVMDN